MKDFFICNCGSGLEHADNCPAKADQYQENNRQKWQMRSKQ